MDAVELKGNQVNYAKLEFNAQDPSGYWSYKVLRPVNFIEWQEGGISTSSGHCVIEGIIMFSLNHQKKNR